MLGAERIELVQLFFSRQRACRFKMIDDGQGHEHGPAPRGHFVDVKRRPAGQQHHLHRDGRQIFPGKLPEQRQVKLAESVHLGDAPETHDGGARFAHERRVRGATSQLQGEVGFDRRVDFARPAVINVPAAVGQLALQNVPDTALLQQVIHFARPMHEEHEIGAERAIHQQLAAPMAIRMLLAKQILLRLAHGAGNLRVGRHEGVGLVGPRARQSNYISRTRHHRQTLS